MIATMLTGSRDIHARNDKTESEQTERARLWLRYKHDGDERARERLVVVYVPLVRHIVREMKSRLPPHVERGELISFGVLGLISAIERFSPSRQVEFETFATARIRGAIVDELRSLDWVPRSIRHKARELQRASTELERQLCRSPSDIETAAILGISVEEFQTWRFEVANSSMVPLDEVGMNSDGCEARSLLDSIEDVHAVDPAGQFDIRETRDHLTGAVSRLPKRERMVICLYYYENVTLREIGEVLGVTDSRANQLRRKAILRLESALADGGGFSHRD